MGYNIPEDHHGAGPRVVADNRRFNAPAPLNTVGDNLTSTQVVPVGNIGVGCAHHYDQGSLFPRDPGAPFPSIQYYALNEMASHFHTRSRAKGFYTDLVTGNPKERNVAEMQMLMVSEIAEMMEGTRKDLMDTHLKHRKMEEVEAADLFIRLMDYCGYRGIDLAGAVREKEAYNEQRADHKLENRAAAGGKKF